MINENDTVATDEIKLGDNDTLAALVTNLIEADALIILTDQAGLFDADPRKNQHAKIVEQADATDPRLESLAGGAGSALGKGGMLTKVLAARRAAQRRAHRDRLGRRARRAGAARPASASAQPPRRPCPSRRASSGSPTASR